MKFIDLQTQYKKIKDDIDLAVQLVLDHGFYVNGPGHLHKSHGPIQVELLNQYHL